jgi:uncharacterized protein (TIGR02271 family)
MTPIPEHPSVISPEGATGIIESDPSEGPAGPAQVQVGFPDGSVYWVPADALLLQPDGSYRLTVPLAAMTEQARRPTLVTRPADWDAARAVADTETTQPAAAPPTLPDGSPESQIHDTGAAATGLPRNDTDGDRGAPAEPTRLSRVVTTHREEITAPLLRDEVSVHRFPVNEYVTEPPPVRYDEDRIIIPVVEEVLLVEKRLLLKEEVVVRRRRIQVPGSEVAVRESQSVEVETPERPALEPDPNEPPHTLS